MYEPKNKRVVGYSGDTPIYDMSGTCLKDDIPTLPTGAWVMQGSQIIVMDGGTVVMYSAEDEKWKDFIGGGA